MTKRGHLAKNDWPPWVHKATHLPKWAKLCPSKTDLVRIYRCKNLRSTYFIHKKYNFWRKIHVLTKKLLASIGPQSYAFDQNEQSQSRPRLTWLSGTGIKICISMTYFHLVWKSWPVSWVFEESNKYLFHPHDLCLKSRIFLQEMTFLWYLFFFHFSGRFRIATKTMLMSG